MVGGDGRYFNKIAIQVRRWAVLFCNGWQATGGQAGQQGSGRQMSASGKGGREGRRAREWETAAGRAGNDVGEALSLLVRKAEKREVERS